MSIVRNRRSGVAAASVAAAVIGVAGAAGSVAMQGGAPQFQPVLASFSFASVHERQRICMGEDGPVIEIRARHEGSQSGDPRLSGKVELEAHNLLSLVTGLGTSEGTFTVRDPETNALKVRGRYHGIFTEGSKFHGVEIATVKQSGRESDLIAFLKADVDLATGEVSGELGGSSADARTPAVLRHGGGCTGPWTRVDSTQGEETR